MVMKVIISIDRAKIALSDDALLKLEKDRHS